MSSQQLGTFAESVFRSKYSFNGVESWAECAERVARCIMLPLLSRGLIEPILIIKMERAIAARKFLPGGRYLYAAGRKYQAISNCFLFRAEDTREGWANLTDRVINALMSGGGIGVVYSGVRAKNLVVKGLGGLSTGPCALMQIQNEAGRQVRQGGSRRSAIWAGLHWNHPDIFDFICLKHWPEWMARAKRENFDNPATMDMTNISVILDTEFFTAFNNPAHAKHDLAVKVYWTALESGLRTGDPGFSIDCGENEGENLRNAPIAGETKVLTDQGYQSVDGIVDEPTTVWTGKQWAQNVVFRKTGFDKPTLIVHMTGRRKIRCEPWHEFILEDGSRVPAADLEIGDSLLVELPKPEAPVRKSKIKVVGIERGKPADVYCANVGVIEHSFCAEGVIISNCTEVTSYYDNDNCNLGSINLARIDSFEEFCEILDLGIQFLIAGSMVGDLPTVETRSVRDRYRRIGLGVMGVHEWLLKQGKRYGPDGKLETWMGEYATATAIAHHYCDKWNISRCIKTRALAPNGTIGIIGETTTCMEPVFAVALKRRWLKNGEWHASFIVDATAKRLIQAGVDPNDIETSYSLSYDLERRIAFQAWMQRFVDHAISSTINLPREKIDTATFGAKLMKHLPHLRGITMYPDGARGGQPLVPVSYRDAIEREGVEIQEMGEEQCPSGVCGL